MGARVSMDFRTSIILFLLFEQSFGHAREPGDSKYSGNEYCTDGRDISRRQVGLCDRVQDCQDGSDERHDGFGFKCSISPSVQRTTMTSRCVLPEIFVRDNVADCADQSDLCYDGTVLISSKCFQCLDGSGTISLSQVCDGTLDCRDFSDECACILQNSDWEQGRKLLRNPICDQLIYSVPFGSNFNVTGHDCGIGDFVCDSNDPSQSNSCIRPGRICDQFVDCPLGEDEKYCHWAAFSCSGDGNIVGVFCDGRIDCPDFSDECNSDCWLSNEFCDSVIEFEENAFGLRCADLNGTQNSSDDFVAYAEVCDGLSNCAGSSNDEAGCLASTHFYCPEHDPIFLNRSDYLDGEIDCSSGSDECGLQTAASGFLKLRSRDAIIKSGAMIFSVFLFGTMALVGNALVFRHTFKELWNDRLCGRLGKLAKCNRILVINLATSDFLMGVYLLTIGTVSLITDGRYCASDRFWRSGTLCLALGFVCQLSSQTSVLTIVLMTSFRLYGTLRPFKAERKNVVYGSLACCVVVWLVSVTVSAIPLIESFSDYFDSVIWLPLPTTYFDILPISEFREMVVRMNTVAYQRAEIFPDLSLRGMLTYLEDVGVKGLRQHWSPNSVRPLGYYNKYPLCVPDFFPNSGDAAWVYSTVIVIFDACSIGYVTVTYLVIYKASSRPAVRKSIRIRSKQWRKDNRAMQKKILLLVITDATCWLPICAMAFANLVRPLDITRDLASVMGGLLLPINSAVNPLIYSSAFWQMLRMVKRKIVTKDDSFGVEMRSDLGSDATSKECTGQTSAHSGTGADHNIRSSATESKKLRRTDVHTH